ncbi:hypothetical protein A3B21_02980 [Candidatus Uhrbacteria bacterium RIFCSPLOWO2_01_FULL_47_24]|uniref:Uncharacterized protein n=1 Tax=Candidatus Uhrbacteria bacterium RIFCSPLOWO2_01_FULL_47_24 TaxID=1802401 RepID=A0A1F7USJ6_9BACT|nr:MAG: hypothetical protein A2753_04455 [Candidatus Uhrbacteria bacterium RIFCSPHIGHO2_01_FULL_47_11]OGL68662.1 MAG: hypothetical protein A3D58_02010 [Candidatus Uhrbacteria bacterium RIFCSPHIGHO2_02_FULL_46_47]OGL76129.1 MAG: hypothetical protein A3F52_01680 [Candidatus Uhrbacteria bacterium RIFCSPHIGHO2_12_FULL_47_11]OGL81229.1 MAG: hypothetical protein A3B21_02980 [Candidatus Uhrbacteria bacterium RIFCSPLOWO2_01_FULL_47_24]OGL84607.1 MAG: hypothetical protein A3J03_02275 [Candidatus Uhrbact
MLKRGFGLLETIIALGVIITGLVSVISLSIANLTNERDTAMRYQAVNLAREGIELVRNIRDSNWLAGTDTWQGIPPGGGDFTIQFNPETQKFAFAPAGGEESVEGARVAQCGDGIYIQPSSFICDKITPFSRTLNLTFKSCVGEFSGDEFASVCEAAGNPTPPVALEISSTVSWNQGAKNITITDILYDWR